MLLGFVEFRVVEYPRGIVTRARAGAREGFLAGSGGSKEDHAFLAPVRQVPPSPPPTRLEQRAFLVWQAASCFRFLRGHATRTADSHRSGCDEYPQGTLPPEHEHGPVERSLQQGQVEAVGCRSRLAHVPHDFERGGQEARG